MKPDKIVVDTARSMAARTVAIIRNEQNVVEKLAERTAAKTPYKPIVKIPPETLRAIYAPKIGMR